jgi:thiamine-phosphate diphosphorylase
VFALYFITPELAPESLVALVARTLPELEPGQACVQLRAKTQPASVQYALAEQLLALCRRHGALFTINDRADIARCVGADGVHLPERGLPLMAARELLGPDALIGVSCHDAAGLEQAASGGASFATLSPVFASPGKGPALGVSAFALLCARAQLPVYALGGVTARHALQLRAAGAAGLAAISAVAAASDPPSAAREFVAAWHAPVAAPSEPASCDD